MRLLRYTPVVAALLGVTFMLGCSSKSSEPVSSTPTPPVETESSAAATTTQETPPLPVEVEATESESSAVMLGSRELTSGIPGEGPLTTEDIAKWLADPANHAALSVQLPLGLAAGAGSIVGLKENPLTRAKVELGRQLFFDRRLSADTTVSCADCHHPEEGFAKHTQFGVGIREQTGGRNSPISYNRILSGAQFWDGRAASLEEQAVGPIANPIEMGNTHENAVETLKGIEGYRIQFEAVFDDGVSIDNVGKAIASFERVIVTGPSAYDLSEPLRVFEKAYKEDIEDLEALKKDDSDLYDEYQALVAASATQPLSESAGRGRTIFFTEKGGCTACHVGANFTDEKYHNLGVGMGAEEPDLGRFAVTQDEKDKGAFKTPTIRNVVHSAPYMHDGSQKTLEEVVEWYNKGGHANPHLSDKIKKLNLTDEEKADLVEFMKACTGDFTPIETGRLP